MQNIVTNIGQIATLSHNSGNEFYMLLLKFITRGSTGEEAKMLINLGAIQSFAKAVCSISSAGNINNINNNINNNKNNNKNNKDSNNSNSNISSVTRNANTSNGNSSADNKQEVANADETKQEALKPINLIALLSVLVRSCRPPGSQR